MFGGGFSKILILRPFSYAFKDFELVHWGGGFCSNSS